LKLKKVSFSITDLQSEPRSDLQSGLHCGRGHQRKGLRPRGLDLHRQADQGSPLGHLLQTSQQQQQQRKRGRTNGTSKLELNSLLANMME